MHHDVHRLIQPFRRNGRTTFMYEIGPMHCAGTADFGTTRTDGREVIADTPASAHRFGCLSQSGINAGLAIDHIGDGVPYRLDKAVDQRCLQAGFRLHC